MKKDNINYLMVGLFTFTGILLLLYMLFKIAGNISDTDQYFVDFENVTGVKDGVVVTYSGYEIGAVSGVEPIVEEGYVSYRLSLLVKSGWRIPEDSKARIVRPTVISGRQVEITQGISKQYLEPGEVISSTEAVDVMKLVDSVAEELHRFIPRTTDNVDKLLTRLNHSADQLASLLSDRNIAHLNNLLEHADTTSQNVSQLADSLNRINKQLNNILDKTDVILGDNSDDIRYTVMEMKKSVSAVSSRIDSVMHNLESTSQNMNEFSRTLRNQPSAIIGSKPPAEQYTEH